MNIVMLLSSCFETYLRTIVSLSFESKPGVIIRCPDSVDGIELLRSSISYGDSSHNQYQFTDQIDDICVGEWTKRFSNFEKYFGKLPEEITSRTSELDVFRTLRNNIAHHFGREKREYDTPLLFEIKPATRVAHERIIKLFRLVHDVASKIDIHLKENYIGAYDIVKLFYQKYLSGEISITNDSGAKALQVMLGKNGYTRIPQKNTYFKNLMKYCGLPQIQESGWYSRALALDRLHKIFIECDEDLNKKSIGRTEFVKYIAEHDCKSNAELCKQNISDNPNEYLYSEKLLKQMAKYFIKKYGSERNKRKNDKSRSEKE